MQMHWVLSRINILPFSLVTRTCIIPESRLHSGIWKWGIHWTMCCENRCISRGCEGNDWTQSGWSAYFDWICSDWIWRGQSPCKRLADRWGYSGKLLCCSWMIMLTTRFRHKGWGLITVEYRTRRAWQCSGVWDFNIYSIVNWPKYYVSAAEYTSLYSKTTGSTN